MVYQLEEWNQRDSIYFNMLTGSISGKAPKWVRGDMPTFSTNQMLSLGSKQVKEADQGE